MTQCDLCTRYEDSVICHSPPSNKYRHSSLPNTKTVCVECANMIATHLIRIGKCDYLDKAVGEVALKIED